MAGTPFERSRTPLQKWFYAMYLFTTSRHGVPAKELQRQLGVTYKCAWRMSNGDIFDDIATRCGRKGVSRNFCGYWQGNKKISEDLLMPIGISA